MDLKSKILSLFPDAEAVPAGAAPGLPWDQRCYLAGGVLRAWDGPMQDVFSPVYVKKDGVFSRVPAGRHPLLDKERALECLDAAAAAYGEGRGEWPAMPLAARLDHIREFARKMVEQKETVCRILSWEIGKTLRDSAKEFDRTTAYINDTIEAVKDLDRTSSRFVLQEGIIAQIRRAPLGVALCMGPFNYPLNETFATLIPALAMGNTVILKPPKHGALLFGPLLEAFRDCFPPGAVNVAYGNGSEIIPPLMASGQVSVLAFIGTSRVAGFLKKQHPKPHRLRCILGTGAKNAAIVLEDADLDLAVPECVEGALAFNGQRCTALKIIFVHANIRESFLSRFTEAVGKLRPGMPWEEDAFLTPLPEPEKPGQLAGFVREALELGASVINPCGGMVNRSFFYPAVLYPVDRRMRIFREEQFGPVVPVAPFSDVEEPVSCIVESDFGQQASVFGKDPDGIARLVDSLASQVCRININCLCQRGPDTFPFTGRKDSAEGTLSVSDALRVFSIRTLAAAKDRQDNKNIFNAIVQGRKSAFLSTDFIL